LQILKQNGINEVVSVWGEKNDFKKFNSKKLQSI
jgi:hypothetical protein